MALCSGNYRSEMLVKGRYKQQPTAQSFSDKVFFMSQRRLQTITNRTSFSDNVSKIYVSLETTLTYPSILSLSDNVPVDTSINNKPPNFYQIMSLLNLSLVTSSNNQPPKSLSDNVSF